MANITRKVDWEERLFQFLEARQHRPFAWGRQDCGMFAADAIREITGYDFVAGVRGRYETARGAERVVGRGSGPVAERTVRKFFHRLKSIPPKLAKRGDLVLVKTPERVERHASAPDDTLGICVGETCVAPGAKGLLHVHMKHARGAWRVG